jgi:tyrosyl-tRNA synthetase
VSTTVFDVLKERGFVEQVSDEAKVRAMLEGAVTCYIGFDPTSDSFHAGSLVPIMALAHMQRHGHRVLAVVGGGTAMIGDPSGKSELRQLISKEEIDANAEGLRGQLARYLDFSGDRAIMVDNADWLRPLNYVEFLRDIGRHFSVNRMLAAEAYKLRLEKGLSFIEFNYQLLQAYDYLTLFRTHGCTLQMGGDDQWGNILAGVDLIRRVEGAQVEAMTFPLLETASGAKMGKTAKGAVWLDGIQTSPYEYYQYWINTDDRDVGRFLKLFTLLPLDDIARLESLREAELNEAKRILAFEATKLTHGDKAAQEARAVSATVFVDAISANWQIENPDINISSLPTTRLPLARLETGIPPAELFTEVGLTPSRGEAKRLIKQGGLYVNDERIDSLERLLTLKDVRPGGMLLKAGKKKIHRIIAD